MKKCFTASLITGVAGDCTPNEILALRAILEKQLQNPSKKRGSYTKKDRRNSKKKKTTHDLEGEYSDDEKAVPVQTKPNKRTDRISACPSAAISVEHTLATTNRDSQQPFLSSLQMPPDLVNLFKQMLQGQHDLQQDIKTLILQEKMKEQAESSSTSTLQLTKKSEPSSVVPTMNMMQHPVLANSLYPSCYVRSEEDIDATQLMNTQTGLMQQSMLQDYFLRQAHLLHK